MSNRSVLSDGRDACNASSSLTSGKTNTMTQVKQQVQEATCVLKKYRQAFSKNVTKGLKMFSGTSASQKDASVYDELDNHHPHPKATVTEAQAIVPNNATTDPVWLTTIEQMGFSRTEIQDAAGSLGADPTPAQIDDLVQILLVMRSSETASTDDADAAPNADEAAPLPSSPPLAAAQESPVPAVLKALEELPPLPLMKSVGSAEFEEATDKNTVLYGGSPVIVPLEISDALGQMGFTEEAIQEAAVLLGPAAKFDDLFDLLVTMAPKNGSSWTGMPSDVLPTMSACPAATEAVRAADALQNRLMEEMSREVKQNEQCVEVNQTEEDIEAAQTEDKQNEAIGEISNRIVATTVIALVLTRIAGKVEAEKGEKTPEKKEMVEEGLPVSPTRGGA